MAGIGTLQRFLFRLSRGPKRWLRNDLVEVWSHGMSNKPPIPFPSRTDSGSKSIFMRERLFLNVANLRYELDVISILTPLPPEPVPHLVAPATSNPVPR